MTRPPAPSALAIVPARAGSQRLPGKHREPVGSLSLVERAIEHARRAALDPVVVTSDDPWTLDAARRRDAVALERPAELATDGATSDAVVAHVLDELEVDDGRVIVLLQPTSPFRDRSVIGECVRLAGADPGCLALSVAALAKPAAWLLRPDANGRLVSAGIDDDLRVPTGAVYACTAGAFRSSGSLHALPKLGVEVAPPHAVDIDDAYELAIARALYDAGMGDDLIDADAGSAPAS